MLAILNVRSEQSCFMDVATCWSSEKTSDDGAIGFIPSSLKSSDLQHTHTNSIRVKTTRRRWKFQQFVLLVYRQPMKRRFHQDIHSSVSIVWFNSLKKYSIPDTLTSISPKDGSKTGNGNSQPTQNEWRITSTELINEESNDADFMMETCE